MTRAYANPSARVTAWCPLCWWKIENAEIFYAVLFPDEIQRIVQARHNTAEPGCQMSQVTLEVLKMGKAAK